MNKIQLLMNKIHLLSFLLLVTLELNAQDAPAGRTPKAIYIEVLGSGLGGSLNYDTRFKPGLRGLGMRVGIGGIDASSGEGSIDVVSLPVLVNYVTGNSRASLEAGVGVTAIYLTTTSTNARSDYFKMVKGFGVLGSGNFGLRLQPKRAGGHFRLYWSPFVTSNGVFEPLWIGASLGIGFR